MSRVVVQTTGEDEEHPDGLLLTAVGGEAPGSLWIARDEAHIAIDMIADAFGIDVEVFER